MVATLGTAPGALPCGVEAWGDTRVEVTFLARDATLVDAITQRERRLAGGSIALAELLDAAPVAVLVA